MNKSTLLVYKDLNLIFFLLTLLEAFKEYKILDFNVIEINSA